MSARPLRVALIGSRGIPNRYGGYETLMEELAERLTAEGVEVTVYCRSHVTPSDMTEYRGAKLVVLPTIRTKYLDTPVHTLLSCLHASTRSYDAALVVNSANAVFVPLLTIAGTPTALHVDGIEKRRAKWGPPGRAVYALSERLAAQIPTVLVTDAECIERHYLERYGAPSTVLTYGVDPEPLPAGEVMREIGLRSRSFFLYVSRFEPENNPHRVVEAYRQLSTDMPLVMVGGAPYADRFIKSFTEPRHPRILFPGPIYGEGYRELLSHARAYIHATEVGGTHPALVEAMGYGNCVVVNDTPENREVAGEAGLYFNATTPASLARRLEQITLDPALAHRRGQMAGLRARERYQWEDVAARYLAMFREMAGC